MIRIPHGEKVQMEKERYKRYILFLFKECLLATLRKVHTMMEVPPVLPFSYLNLENNHFRWAVWALVSRMRVAALNWFRRLFDEFHFVSHCKVNMARDRQWTDKPFFLGSPDAVMQILPDPLGLFWLQELRVMLYWNLFLSEQCSIFISCSTSSILYL